MTPSPRPGGPADADRAVRLHVYRRLIEAGRPPSTPEIAEALGRPSGAIAESLQRLAEGRALVLVPGSTGIWMAPPFSAIPTRYRVRIGGSSFWAPCIWDAFGIAALLPGEAVIESRCPSSGEPMRLDVRDGAVTGSEGVVHFLVPAAHWWDDIGFT